MLFPYHKYLGPGNEITFENPVDEDDRLALIYDLDYEFSKNESDISNSDSFGSVLFLKNFLETSNVHSLIGL